MGKQSKSKKLKQEIQQKSQILEYFLNSKRVKTNKVLLQSYLQNGKLNYTNYIKLNKLVDKYKYDSKAQEDQNNYEVLLRNSQRTYRICSDLFKKGPLRERYVNSAEDCIFQDQKREVEQLAESELLFFKELRKIFKKYMVSNVFENTLIDAVMRGRRFKQKSEIQTLLRSIVHKGWFKKSGDIITIVR